MNLLTKLKNVILYKENDAHEFAPLLTEIEERPMNPLGSTIFWLVIVFMVIASLWMYLGKVDVVITARGVVIPYGEEKLIQSLDKGVVRNLEVNEGDYVEKGQTLAIITPAEHEPGLELISLAQEEKALNEQIASVGSSLQIALSEKRRLDSVRDLIAQPRYDEVLNQVNTLFHEKNRLLAELASVRNKRIQLENLRQVLVSPIDGYVGQIFIHTVGGVVSPAEKVMTVVPKNAKLSIKATVLNQDIGFIKPDMPVSVKIDTYNFQKYGMLDGVVSVISPNSTENEKLGPVYEVYITPINNSLTVEGKTESLKIGMTTTNEIKIGKRRIIEFFIYPLIKYLDESIKVQ